RSGTGLGISRLSWSRSRAAEVPQRLVIAFGAGLVGRAAWRLDCSSDRSDECVSRSVWSGTKPQNAKMSVFKNGTFYHYEFQLDGRRHRGSTGTASKPQAISEERRQRERLQKGYSQVIEEEAREQQRKTIQQAAEDFLVEYKAKHESPTFAVYALGHVTDHLGKKLVVEITPT